MKTRSFVLKTRSFVLKTRSFVFQMMDFAVLIAVAPLTVSPGW